MALLYLGAETAGWVLAGLVTALALLSAISGLCVGCEVYRLLLARRSGAGADVRDDLGLRGQGPWLVVLTAPGCARCEPFAREIERAADGREVVRVSLADHPARRRAARAQRAGGARGRRERARARRPRRPSRAGRIWTG